MMIARSSSLCFAAFFLLAFAAQAQDTGVELHGCVKAEGKVQAELRLFAGSNPDPKVFNWAKTDDKGCFVIKGVEPGARRLNVSADGYDFAVKDLQVSTEKVQLLPEIQLEKAVGVLVGRVLDPRGEAVAFAEVMVPFSSRGSLTPPPLRRTSTQVDGTFKLENLPAGSYTFEARHPKYQFLNETIEIKRATVSHDFKLSGEPFQQLTLVALSPKASPCATTQSL
jgi:Carboxypeptidase regulatory-like domain